MRQSVISSLFLAAGLLCFAGCMSSRGVCSVKAPGEVTHAMPVNKYRITHVQQLLPDGRVVDVHSNRRMREMLDDDVDLDNLMSYAPGCWDEANGIPVTITFFDWEDKFETHWTIVPCILTLGICPYCHHEEIKSNVMVSLDDGSQTAFFSYSEREDWKISFLFALGSIPYSDEVLARNEFQQCGQGDVLRESHFNGLAHGIATALADLERNAKTK